MTNIRFVVIQFKTYSPHTHTDRHIDKHIGPTAPPGPLNYFSN